MSNIKFEIDGDTKGAQSSIDGVSKSLKGLEDKAKGLNSPFESLGKILKFTGAAAAISIITNSLGKAVDEARNLGDKASTSQKTLVQLADKANSFRSAFSETVADITVGFAKLVGFKSSNNYSDNTTQKGILTELEKQNKINEERLKNAQSLKKIGLDRVIQLKNEIDALSKLRDLEEARGNKVKSAEYNTSISFRQSEITQIGADFLDKVKELQDNLTQAVTAKTSPQEKTPAQLLEDIGKAFGVPSAASNPFLSSKDNFTTSNERLEELQRRKQDNEKRILDLKGSLGDNLPGGRATGDALRAGGAVLAAGGAVAGAKFAAGAGVTAGLMSAGASGGVSVGIGKLFKSRGEATKELNKLEDENIRIQNEQLSIGREQSAWRDKLNKAIEQYRNNEEKILDLSHVTTEVARNQVKTLNDQQKLLEKGIESAIELEKRAEIEAKAKDELVDLSKKEQSLTEQRVTILNQISDITGDTNVELVKRVKLQQQLKSVEKDIKDTAKEANRIKKEYAQIGERISDEQNDKRRRAEVIDDGRKQKQIAEDITKAEIERIEAGKKLLELRKELNEIDKRSVNYSKEKQAVKDLGLVFNEDKQAYVRTGKNGRSRVVSQADAARSIADRLKNQARSDEIAKRAGTFKEKNNKVKKTAEEYLEEITDYLKIQGDHK